jgi:aromatic-amino-acid transaminase
MFDTLRPQAADKIMALMQAYRDDPREVKIDLGLGVYKDAEGRTPVMAAVKAAEQLLWQAETTKTYTGLAGEPSFNQAMRDMILAGAVPEDRIASIATPGGTGAIRQALELVKLANPEATVWLSDPTWPNHAAILGYLGIPAKDYRYFDLATCGVDLEGMLADLGRVRPGDVVLLHGCCHNPTGANPTEAEWQRIVDVVAAAGAVPLVDLAYQGFGDGLEADAFATRLIARRLPEVLIAASCSKNFGIYRERTGVLMAISAEASQTGVMQQNLSTLNRLNYSFPPDHGARLVTMILGDPALRGVWQDELEAVRAGMLDLRQQLADELRKRTNSDRFDFIARHRGMFSRLGATPAQVAEMRERFGIYMIGDSRINIAGLNARTVPLLAEAMVAVGV